MADGGIGNQSPATLFQARLNTDGGVSPDLTLGQYAGSKVVVAGVTVAIPLAGLTVNIGDNLISAVGADSGGPPAASTLYYVYVSNRKASFSPESIRLSATPPSLVNGVKYLGSSGNALNWRFVGWVYPNATPNFESSLESRLICNYYNRLTLPLFICSGYTDADDATFVSIPTGTTWVGFDDGITPNRLNFISNGEDAVQYMGFAGSKSSLSWYLGIAEDSNVSPSIQTVQNTVPGATVSSSVGRPSLLAEGFHFVRLLGIAFGGTDFWIDLPRQGALHDPAVMYLEASVEA